MNNCARCAYGARVVEPWAEGLCVGGIGRGILPAWVLLRTKSVFICLVWKEERTS
jgi:hypothetical protein